MKLVSGQHADSTFNVLQQTVDTKDGTQVAVELVENVQCLADVLMVSLIREQQRKEKEE